MVYELKSDSDIIELERIALEHAKEAVELDKKGVRPLAIIKYQSAIDALMKLIHIDPDSPLSRVYMKKIREYRDRIQFLRGMLAEDARNGLDIDYEQQKTEQAFFGLEEFSQYKSYKSSITWDDVVDLEEVKKILRQSIVYPTLRPDLFPLGWPRGLLLYGPPGCGKTTIAAAVSNEIDGFFYPVDAASLMSKWLGETEKNIARLFNFLRRKAKEGRPVILFIDEADSLLSSRREEVGGEARARNQFLKEMDGLLDKSNGKIPLYVIAATNKPWNLDVGFIRRFQKRIYVPMPNYNVRIQLFRYFLRNVNKEDIDYDKLAKLTEGYTSSDIRDVCQTAVIEVATELFESGKYTDPNSKPRPVNMNDLLAAIRRIRPSISKEMIRVYEGWAERFRSI